MILIQKLLAVAREMISGEFFVFPADSAQELHAMHARRSAFWNERHRVYFAGDMSPTVRVWIHLTDQIWEGKQRQLGKSTGSSEWWRRWMNTEAASDRCLGWRGTKRHQLFNRRVIQRSLRACSCHRRIFWAFIAIKEHTYINIVFIILWAVKLY